MNNHDIRDSAIACLQHTDHAVALQIQKVFFRAYKVEAKLIGVTHFPPLERKVVDIIASDTIFYGYQFDDKLLAVIEVNYQPPQLDINSLVVHPDYFRQGLAGELLGFVLNYYHWETAVVETALANFPAIALYEQHGFTETRHFQIPMGITKVSLKLEGGFSKHCFTDSSQ